MKPTKLHILEWLGDTIVLVKAETKDGRKKTMVLKAIAWGEPSKKP